ncbi:hypothetical protein JAO73_13315 [Hymenobacter sp. BT523]|uniref:hypothetical protein n=1 Tax=Hymenobacter sp. BT523 TaxID=2795725 RepID=UPI0018EA7F6D|nr:hypothetical protein [Hymenobacter sp. BT523]MBJ6109996.1 hypothetical protein [Hymenobacter sp. BT523]
MSQALESASASMTGARARQRLAAVRRSYAWRRAAAVLLPAVAAALLLGLLAQRWPASRGMLAATAVVGLGIGVWLLWPLRRLRPAVITARLDRQFPELEDSAGLLLRGADELNLLERFQQRRVAQRLHALQEEKRLTIPVSFRRAVSATGLLLLAAAVAWWWPAKQAARAPRAVAVHFSEKQAAVPSQAPARIAETQLLVTPPAYTRQAAFGPAQASFQCPEGSRVRWQLRVSGGGRLAPTLEIGRLRRPMQPVAGQPGRYYTELTLTASTLYRLRLGGTVSDDYAIDVRADQAPVLRIQTPKPYTLVEAYGRRPEVAVRATARDDYGLSRAEMVITVAQGQGEAVKFREARRDLTAALRGGAVQASLTGALNLPRLGLTYGDELYFYLTARDNAGHTSRTDAYLVQWQDTAVADSPADVGMGVKVAPAYFRSQRQIIIDTEKLIAEKPKLDAATVASRANALGFDQQTLRLRYGKFMGEESEQVMGSAPHSPIAEEEEAPGPPTAEAPEEHPHEDHAAPLAASSAKASPTAETDELMDPYMHKHDDAETADFLEPAVKAKLRAVLNEMWAAELRLRTGQLAAARPYEYRALRLLKQVQQQTRAFVKKAGFTPPPMPEATLRLTGELKGAAAPRRQQQVAAAVSQPAVRAALRWLAAHGPGTKARPAEAPVLEQAGSVLAGAALERPGLYLPALKALRQLVADVRAGRPTCPDCRLPVERALTDLLAAPSPVPVPPAAPDRLGRRYFQELSR